MSIVQAILIALVYYLGRSPSWPDRWDIIPYTGLLSEAGWSELFWEIR